MSNSDLNPPPTPPTPDSALPSPKDLPGWRAWTWVPSLYYVQGLPYTIVNVVSVPMYKNLGVANSEITFWTSWFGFVWALKALWSPFVDGVSTKRRWTVAMQTALVPVSVALVFALSLPSWMGITLVLFALMSLISATHDIAADGLYMLGLTDGQQAAFVGVRSTFWRLALISGEGLLVMLAGVVGSALVDDRHGWQVTLGVVAAIFAVAAAYNAFAMPRVAEDVPRETTDLGHNTQELVTSFFTKPGIVLALLFILFFRFSENHISGLVSPFLLDPIADGGMGWTLAQVGFAKGTVGVVSLVVGGILGGVAIYAHGLRAWLLPMCAFLNLPNAVYWLLAATKPATFGIGVALIGVEQFGYGFGFAAYLMFLIKVANGRFKTAHYAFATGLMALSVWAAKVWSGWAQELLGYEMFFAWACVAAIPAFLISFAVLRDIPADFGRRGAKESS